MYKYIISFITLLFLTVTQAFALSPWEPPFWINSIQQTSENIIISGGSWTVHHDDLSIVIFDKPVSAWGANTSIKIYSGQNFSTQKDGTFTYSVKNHIFTNLETYEVVLYLMWYEIDRKIFTYEADKLCEILNNCLPQESKITSISDGFHPVIAGVSRSLTNLELQIDELIPSMDSIHSHWYTKVYSSSRENFMIDSKGWWAYNVQNNNIFKNNRIYLARFLENWREVDSKRFIFESQQNISPTCTLTSSDVSIIQWENAEIRWFTQNADVVTLTHHTTWNTSEVNSQWTRIVTPNTTEQFIITATNSTDSVRCSVEITVSKLNTEATITTVSDDFNPLISGTATSAHNLEIKIDELVTMNTHWTMRHDRVYTSSRNNFVMHSKGWWFYEVKNDWIFERWSLYYIQLRYNWNYSDEKTFVYRWEILDRPFKDDEDTAYTDTSWDYQWEPVRIELSVRDQRMADRVVDVLNNHLNSSSFSWNNRSNEIILIQGRLENLTNHSRFSNIAWYLIDSLERLR